MLMQSQQDQGSGNSLPGRVSRVSKLYRKNARWAGVGMTVMAAAVIASCSASEITGPTAFTSEALAVKRAKSGPLVMPPQQPGTAEATPINEKIVTPTMELPMPAVVVDPCNGEAVAVDGKYILHFHSVATPSGNFHVYMSEETKGKGTGALSGNPYVIDDKNMKEFESAPATEVTTVTHQLYVSQGPLPNFLQHTTFHMTVSAAGIVNVTDIKPKTECTGSKP